MFVALLVLAGIVISIFVIRALDPAASPYGAGAAAVAPGSEP